MSTTLDQTATGGGIRPTDEIVAEGGRSIVLQLENIVTLVSQCVTGKAEEAAKVE